MERTESSSPASRQDRRRSGSATRHLQPDDIRWAFDAYHSAIYGYIARVAGRQAADDLASEVFCIALDQRNTFDPAKGSLRAWLYGIATNLLRTHARSLRRSTRAVQRVAAERVGLGDIGEQVADRLLSEAQHRALIHALLQLPQRHQEVLILQAWEGLTYEEISDALGVPIGTVRSRISRGRQRMRELLARSGQSVARGGT